MFFTFDGIRIIGFLIYSSVCPCERTPGGFLVGDAADGRVRGDAGMLLSRQCANPNPGLNLQLQLQLQLQRPKPRPAQDVMRAKSGS